MRRQGSCAPGVHSSPHVHGAAWLYVWPAAAAAAAAARESFQASFSMARQLDSYLSTSVCRKGYPSTAGLHQCISGSQWSSWRAPPARPRCCRVPCLRDDLPPVRGLLSQGPLCQSTEEGPSRRRVQGRRDRRLGRRLAQGCTLSPPQHHLAAPCALAHDSSLATSPRGTLGVHARKPASKSDLTKVDVRGFDLTTSRQERVISHTAYPSDSLQGGAETRQTEVPLAWGLPRRCAGRPCGTPRRPAPCQLANVTDTQSHVVRPLGQLAENGVLPHLQLHGQRKHTARSQASHASPRPGIAACGRVVRAPWAAQPRTCAAATAAARGRASRGGTWPPGRPCSALAGWRMPSG